MVELSKKAKWCFAWLLIFLSGCASFSPAVIEKEKSVAVWDLENLTPEEGATSDIGELLAAGIIEILKEDDDFIVVEREKLLLTLEELNLGTSSLIDDSTKLRIGLMAGARMMIFGGYQVIGDMIRIDLRIIEVETGRLVKAGEKTIAAANMSDWLKATKDLTSELLE
jgi:TolB-like protein